MENTNPIKKSFSVLAGRLSHYETGKYLLSTTTPKVDPDYHFDYVNTMDKLAVDVNWLGHLEVFEEANFYVQRIEKIYNSLQKRTHKPIDDLVVEGGTVIPYYKVIELNEEEQESLFTEWKDELAYFITALKQIMEARSHIISKTENHETDKQITVINLPATLPLKELHQYFEPRLSPLQAALLLQFLQDLHVVPPYGNPTTCLIGKYLFGRHEKAIAKGQKRIENLETKTEDLEYLQTLLSSVSKKIEQHLKLLK